LTSGIFFDKLRRLLTQFGAKRRMAEDSLLFSTTMAGDLDRAIYLVDAGKLESGL
jgi:hypothetical protein